MGIGEDMKADVDAIREEFGTDCTLTRSDGSTVALGKCSFEEYTPARAQGILGGDYVDEIGKPWAMIEVPAGKEVKEDDKLTVDGTDWIVYRVIRARLAGVLVAERCLCIGKMV